MNGKKNGKSFSNKKIFIALITYMHTTDYMIGF